MQISGITSGTRWLRRGLIVAAATGFLGTGLSIHTVAAHDDDRVHRGGCSNASLRGDYGFLVSGFKPVPPPLGGGLERFNAVGIYSFDGDGAFTFEGGALQGEITGTNRDPLNVVGSYEVNANCTGSMSWQPDPPLPVFIRFSIVIVDRGQEVKLASTNGLAQGEAIRK